MKLSEKIYQCRKKAGLSQEALAECLGVSRQAVSKWETGESEPELGKLRQLAAVFAVSADWLLSDQEEPEQPVEPASSASSQGGMDSLPGFLRHTARKYGWLLGVYIAVGGFFIMAVGIVARLVSKAMLSNFSSSLGSGFGTSLGGGFATISGLDGFPGIAGHTASIAAPFMIITGFAIVIGTILFIGGIVLAVYLKKKGTKKD